MAEDERRVKAGWRGRFFEDFAVGDVYEHPLGRTVTETDNVWMTLLTQNTAPIHFDSHYAAQTEFGRRLVDSTFTLALVTGQSVTDVSQNVMPPSTARRTIGSAAVSSRTQARSESLP